MSQHDLNIANQGFPAFRSDLNNALAALGTSSSGSTEPSTTFANQLWADTGTANKVILKMRNSDNDAWVSILQINLTSDSLEKVFGLVIGTDVQAYDADTLKADVADTLTAPFRGAVTTDNDMSFSMASGNNFTATPTGSATLTFTNITAGQSGNIYVNNSGGYAISAASTTLISSADLTKLSTAGSYWVSYYSADGTNVNVAVSPALTAAGA